MGRFHRKIKILAKTEHPVFVKMSEADTPIPVDPRVFYPWAEAQPKPKRYQLMATFREFTMSERYSRVVATPGAQYHDLDGNVTRSMPDTSVQGAQTNLANIEKMKAGNLAKKPSP